MQNGDRGASLQNPQASAPGSDANDRSRWLRFYGGFVQKCGINVSSLPTIYGKADRADMACLKARKGFEIDLFSLFLLVKRYGGYEQIVDDAVWVEIARSLDESLQAHSSVAKPLRQIYLQYLYLFESFMRQKTSFNLAMSRNQQRVLEQTLTDQEPPQKVAHSFQAQGSGYGVQSAHRGVFPPIVKEQQPHLFHQSPGNPTGPMGTPLQSTNFGQPAQASSTPVREDVREDFFAAGSHSMQYPLQGGGQLQGMQARAGDVAVNLDRVSHFDQSAGSMGAVGLQQGPGLGGGRIGPGMGGGMQQGNIGTGGVGVGGVGGGGGGGGGMTGSMLQTQSYQGNSGPVSTVQCTDGHGGMVSNMGQGTVYQGIARAGGGQQEIGGGMGNQLSQGGNSSLQARGQQGGGMMGMERVGMMGQGGLQQGTGGGMGGMRDAVRAGLVESGNRMGQGSMSQGVGGHQGPEGGGGLGVGLGSRMGMPTLHQGGIAQVGQRAGGMGGDLGGGGGRMPLKGGPHGSSGGGGGGGVGSQVQGYAAAMIVESSHQAVVETAGGMNATQQPGGGMGGMQGRSTGQGGIEQSSNLAGSLLRSAELERGRGFIVEQGMSNQGSRASSMQSSTGGGMGGAMQGVMGQNAMQHANMGQVGGMSMPGGQQDAVGMGQGSMQQSGLG
ncbi:hypothetical protein GUITHDRAFT_111176 [Guillardia theta CCMP2712]|uniref:ARID domain-containing protein n=1 Tax=Guillardia theta (strain CCMP2712) TaxID=905079 RepID=L1J2T6_GUITC|nr:hypothetical protein GUITHDRAFT_111176 [Guillardia theta CCMP2712]EKX42806.1 hypothetical protein GUITHDRAFT_111176 [Guillardia theta CCMP2712]|eukprot:XP_005829786.1 hypothetical protein GUITHDRAFT_111176 [Guillardia theta CCMP2712]